MLGPSRRRIDFAVAATFFLSPPAEHLQQRANGSCISSILRRRRQYSHPRLSSPARQLEPAPAPPPPCNPQPISSLSNGHIHLPNAHHQPSPYQLHLVVSRPTPTHPFFRPSPTRTSRCKDTFRARTSSAIFSKRTLRTPKRSLSRIPSFSPSSHRDRARAFAGWVAPTPASVRSCTSFLFRPESGS